MNASCDTCVFFEPGRNGFTGRCKRNPPSHVVDPNNHGERLSDKVRSMWPIVRADEWCGEHATRESAA